MTIQYADEVQKSNTWNFFKLLFRWKGSLWKAIWAELLLWLSLYTAISLLYRIVLSDHQRLDFEKVVKFWSQFTGSGFVPLTFILGFFVNLVVHRWWDMYQSIGGTESVATLLASYIDVHDDETITMKRNIVRYMVLTQALVFLKISGAFRQRYPDMEAIKNSGLINDTEMETMESIESPNAKHWVPIYWAMSLIKQAKKDGKVECDSDCYVIDLYTKLRDFKGSLGKISSYMTVPIPLAYTQVVFIAVRLYFAIALLANQYLDPKEDAVTLEEATGTGMTQIDVQFGMLIGDADFRSSSAHRLGHRLSFLLSEYTVPAVFSALFAEGTVVGVDLYFPFGTVIQFFFYVGWIKVAESLFNPFGGDDNDFEIDEILARNLQNGLNIVDGAFNKTPTQLRDPYSQSGSNAPFSPKKRMSLFEVPITAVKRGITQFHDSTVAHYNATRDKISSHIFDEENA